MTCESVHRLRFKYASMHLPQYEYMDMVHSTYKLPAVLNDMFLYINLTIPDPQPSSITRCYPDFS